MIGHGRWLVLFKTHCDSHEDIYLGDEDFKHRVMDHYITIEIIKVEFWNKTSGKHGMQRRRR